MQDGAERFIGSIPDYYEAGLVPVIFEPYAKILAARLAAIAPERVLETACGTGVVTRRLLDGLPAGARLVATDLNAAMLARARKSCGEDPRLEFREANAQALPFEDGAFEALVCQFGVMFFPDKELSFREARRVLAPGGRYLFAVWDRLELNAPQALTARLLAERFPADPPRFFDVPYSLFSIDALRASLAATGFCEARFDVIPVEAEMPDRRAFAEAMVRGCPLEEQVRGRGGDVEGLIDALHIVLELEFGASGRTPLQAVLVEALRS